jgi:NADP-dependent 3-hydroxy acid dehydrogenase YdfG
MAFMMKLSGKWILITGASSGFGAAAAKAFGAEGAHVVLGARRVDRLKAVAAEHGTAGAASAHVHALDVATLRQRHHLRGMDRRAQPHAWTF